MASNMERSLLGKGNDFVDEDEQYCQSCSVRGNSVPAKTFCVDCGEAYCQQCTIHHQTLKITKHHVLVKADEAKKTPSIAVKDKCRKKCTDHKDKGLKYFCLAHSQLGCSVCVTLNHKLCNNVEHIPTVAMHLNDHAGFNQFDEGIKNLETAYTTSIADIQKNLKLLQADEHQVQQAFKDFRKQMNDALNKLEIQITTEAKKIKDNETKKLDALIKKLEKSQTKFDVIANELRLLLSSGRNSDAYVLSKTDVYKLSSLQEELASTTERQTFQRFTFEPSTDSLKVGALGKLITRSGGPVSSWSALSSQAPPKPKAAQSIQTPPKRQVAPLSQAAASAPTTVTKDEAYWEDMAEKMKVGDRVRRGRDWPEWRSNENGGPGALGTVKYKRVIVGYGGECVCEVRWDNGHTTRHNMRPCFGYQLEIV